MTQYGLLSPPAVSTVGEVLKRHGLVAKRRRRGSVFGVERSETSDLILVRYANVRLGQLDTSAKPRLLPVFSDKGWEMKPIRTVVS